MKNNHGFTLTELMVSIVAASIVVAGAYATYDYQQESYLNQEQVANMQQNLRAGLYFMLREVRMAGYDPSFNAEASFLIADRGEMKFEVDVFWVQVGGKDPVALIRSLKGRVSQLHLKDLNASIDTPNYGSIPPEAFEELGDGVIPMEPIIEVAAEAGVDHCHVEQDHSPHPLQSIRESMQHLNSL